MKKLNVLSLFNGMGCVWLALDGAGIEVGKRYSSEIDKYAIKLNDALYPDTIQLGDVKGVDVSKLGHIDLVTAGSPCQSFSFAGKRKGMSTTCEIEIVTLEQYLKLKSEGFEFEGQSYLFWEFVRILEELKVINPDIKFLFENVEMGKEWETVLCKALGYNAIHINSALVSAQNRKRIYIVNFGLAPGGLFGDLESVITQPKDRGILLRDVLENEVAEKYYLSDKMMSYFKTRAKNFNNGKVNIRDEEGKSSCLTASMASCDISDNFIKVDTDLKKSKNQDKANCFTAGGNSGGLHSDMTLIVASRGRENSGTLTQNIGSSSPRNVKDFRIRRLTERECCRLQTIPEPAIDKMLSCGVSGTQVYRAVGNGWTIDVIAYLFSYLNVPENEI